MISCSECLLYDYPTTHCSNPPLPKSSPSGTSILNVCFADGFSVRHYPKIQHAFLLAEPDFQLVVELVHNFGDPAVPATLELRDIHLAEIAADAADLLDSLLRGENGVVSQGIGGKAEMRKGIFGEGKGG